MTKRTNISRTEVMPSLGDYLKSFMFHSDIGLIFTVAGVLTAGLGAVHVAERVLDHYFPQPKQIIQQNVIGDEQLDTYIEKKGVKYYSHIDGKDITDFVIFSHKIQR